MAASEWQGLRKSRRMPEKQWHGREWLEAMQRCCTVFLAGPTVCSNTAQVLLSTLTRLVPDGMYWQVIASFAWQVWLNVRKL